MLIFQSVAVLLTLMSQESRLWFLQEKHKKVGDETPSILAQLLIVNALMNRPHEDVHHVINSIIRDNQERFCKHHKKQMIQVFWHELYEQYAVKPLLFLEYY